MNFREFKRETEVGNLEETFDKFALFIYDEIMAKTAPQDHINYPAYGLFKTESMEGGYHYFRKNILSGLGSACHSFMWNKGPFKDSIMSCMRLISNKGCSKEAQEAWVNSFIHNEYMYPEMHKTLKKVYVEDELTAVIHTPTREVPPKSLTNLAIALRMPYEKPLQVMAFYEWLKSGLSIQMSMVMATISSLTLDGELVRDTRSEGGWHWPLDVTNRDGGVHFCLGQFLKMEALNNKVGERSINGRFKSINPKRSDDLVQQLYDKPISDLISLAGSKKVKSGLGESTINVFDLERVVPKLKEIENELTSQT